MLQTYDIGCCIKEDEGGAFLMLDVACNAGRNMGRLGIMMWEEVSGGETWTDPQGVDPSSCRLIGADRELRA
jgi:hypothetical protein